jgi:hypothetical protein
MEQFFTWTNRFQELFDQDRDSNDSPFEYTEEELAVPVEECFIYHWDCADLLAFVTGGVMRKILWITNDAYLLLEDGEYYVDDRKHDAKFFIQAEIQAMSGQEQTLTLASIVQEDMVVSNREIGVFWRAIMTCNSVKLKIQDYGYCLAKLPSSGPLLSQLLRGSPSLQVLELVGLHFKEEHCRALATVQRTDLEVKFCQCTFDPQDTMEIFIDWVRNNQIVTELDDCEIIVRSRAEFILSGH